MPAKGFRQKLGPVLTWVGVVGTAITVFSNLQAVLDMADWARWIVEHWTEWSRAFWSWSLGWLGWSVPDPLVPLLTGTAFCILLGISHRNAPLDQVYGRLHHQAMDASVVLCYFVFTFPGLVEFIVWMRQALPAWQSSSRALFGGALLTAPYIFYIFVRGIVRPPSTKFSWKPILVALTVLLLLGLNEMSKLGLAPSLRAPQ